MLGKRQFGIITIIALSASRLFVIDAIVLLTDYIACSLLFS
jgi:hypothetical protein